MRKSVSLFIATLLGSVLYFNTATAILYTPEDGSNEIKLKKPKSQNQICKKKLSEIKHRTNYYSIKSA